MLCTFCGTENRQENKFCGMCGVRLERRKAERRVRQDSMKCQSCGHINELGHKFCGMCGSRVDQRALERRAAVPEELRATAIANAQLPTPEATGHQSKLASPLVASDKETQPSPASEVPLHTKTPPAIFRSEPPRGSTIGGPSFLGLGDEPQDSGDYLLEDEGSSGGVLRRLVLIAILAAIAGLMFVGWRSISRANPKPAPLPQPTTSSSPQGQSQDRAPDAAQDAKNPDSSPAGAAKSDAKGASAAGGETSSGTTAAAEEVKPSEPGNDNGNDKAERGKTAHEPPEDVSPAQRRPSAMLVRAQQYLQGRGGVKQNCEQGLMYLRAATQKNEPAAAVQMGALYASGHCVQRDQVMAYRWFNSAHELDPANPWIQTNLDQLWAQMTPQERQRAGR